MINDFTHSAPLHINLGTLIAFTKTKDYNLKGLFGQGSWYRSVEDQSELENLSPIKRRKLLLRSKCLSLYFNRECVDRSSNVSKEIFLCK